MISNENALIEIIEQNPWIYEHLNDNVKSNREIAKAALLEDGALLEFAPDCITDDKELVCVALESDYVFKYASYRLQHDKEVIMYAIEQGRVFMDELDEEFMEDLEILYKVVQCLPHYFTYFAKELREDREVVLNCIKIEGKIYQYLNDKLKADWGILEAAVRQGLPLSWIVRDKVESYEDVINDPELVLCAIKHNGGNELCYASEEIQHDKEFGEFALKRGLTNIACLNEKMKASKAVVRKIFKNILVNGFEEFESKCVHDLPDKVKMNEDFMLELIKDNPFVFRELSRYGKYNNLEFFIKAYKTNPQTIKYMVSYMKKDVKDAIKSEV